MLDSDALQLAALGAGTQMRQLRGEDARFVYADTGHANSNITLVSIYDPSTAADGRVHFKGLLKHIESRLHLSPIFRQKLLRVPLELDHPYWIEDERFDLEYHARHVALPKPGDWRQFCIQVSRIHARPLDMTRPLWELYLVEGLDAFVDLPKDSFALLTKLHHAAIDVRRGTAIITLLHDTTPRPPKQRVPPKPPGSPRKQRRAPEKLPSGSEQRPRRRNRKPPPAAQGSPLRR